jgi:hypothetical protein
MRLAELAPGSTNLCGSLSWNLFRGVIDAAAQTRWREPGWQSNAPRRRRSGTRRARWPGKLAHDEFHRFDVRDVAAAEKHGDRRPSKKPVMVDRSASAPICMSTPF